MLHRLPLTRRLTLLFTLVVAGVVLGLGGLFMAAAHRHFIELDRAALRDKQQLVEDLFASADSAQAVRERLLQALGHHHGLFVRVADAFLGRGVGRAMLRHLIAEARAQGMTSLWLETGSGEAFAPAIGLYASEGFVACEAFEGYVDDPFSRFMTLAL